MLLVMRINMLTPFLRWVKKVVKASGVAHRLPLKNQNFTLRIKLLLVGCMLDLHVLPKIDNFTYFDQRSYCLFNLSS